MRPLFFSLLFLFIGILMAQDYQQAYREIDALTEQGKYRSALDRATELFGRAEQAGDADQMIKALGYRAAFVQNLEEDGQQATLNLLREELADHADRPIVAGLLHLLTGELYHYYGERNSYRLSEQTELAATVITDTTSLANYSLGQLREASQRHLYQALSLARRDRTALAEVAALIEGEDRIEEVPTLYDLIVDRALQVLGSPLGGLTDQQPSNADALLAPAEKYVDTELAERFDTTKGTPRKLAVYQDWLRYHLDGDADPALLHADRERLAFVRSVGASDSAYAAALERAYTYYAGVTTRERLLVDLARLYHREAREKGERPRVRALAILDRIENPDPVARIEAERLRANIQQTQLAVNVWEYYPRETPLLVGVTYSNVEELHYRVYRFEPQNDNRNYEEIMRSLLRQRPEASGRQRLAANDDYASHSTELSMQALPAGPYRVVVSDRNDFNYPEDLLASVDFQVSDLAVVRVSTGDETSMQVTDRVTGAARAGVEIELQQRNRNYNFRTVGNRTTNEQGIFRLPGGERYRNYRLLLTDGNDRLTYETYDYTPSRSPDRKQRYTTLLTDRPLYRPGQTVKVYGLRYEKDLDQMPTIVTEETLQLSLRGANYADLGEREVKVDEYGRLYTEFELPTGGLTGNFSIYTEGGTVSFRVEEYKRPRFQVKLEQPAPVERGETVSVTGNALSYAGPAISEAKVNYRVFLEELNYYFYFFGGGGDDNQKELLASGTTTTAEDGSFSIEVTTRADLKPTGYRRYRYTVEVDVADATGETHEAKTTIPLKGQRPNILVRPHAELVDRGDSLRIDITSLDPGASLAIGLRILPVAKPYAALRVRPWDIPDRPVIDSVAFTRDFPNLAYRSTPDLDEWPATGGAVYENALVGIEDGKATVNLPAEFPVGHYRIEWTFPDGTEGVPATFGVYDTEAEQLPPGVLHHLEQAGGPAQVGQPLTFTLLSAVDLPLVFQGWHSRNGHFVDRTQCERMATFTYTPQEIDRGGLNLNLSFVRFNGYFDERRRIELPWDNKKLKVTYATFRDRLRPGEPERWTVNVAAADGEPVPAAALATMYDASLDQLYRGGGWQFSPYPNYYYGGSLIETGSFGSQREYAAGRLPEIEETQPILPRLQLPQFTGYGGYAQPVAYSLQGRAAGATVRGTARMRKRMAEPEMSTMAAPAAEAYAFADEVREEAAGGQVPPPPPPSPGAPQDGNLPPTIQVRTKLQETAFWLPELTAAPDGSLDISFESPEALTAWKFRLFLHDKNLHYVIDEREVITQKELMVLPNVPRFLREGDRMELTAKVSNTTGEAMEVDVDLELFNPQTNESLDLNEFLGGAAGEDQDEILAGPYETRLRAMLEAGASTTIRFPLSIPDGKALEGPIGYRLIARSDNFSDGEENFIPVLTDRTLVTVTNAFYLKRRDTKTIELPLLGEAVNPEVDTRNNVSYTFEATTNPAWMALKALPYLMEYPYDCTEQIANRYFANQLAYVTVSTRPVLEEVFRKWQADSTALLSELEQNQDLKNALLTETPWVREAQDESAQRARIGELFKLKKLAEEQEEALAKLEFRQNDNGAYSWFPGGRPNRYMTQYVLETLARMQQLGVVGGDQQQRTAKISTAAIRFLDRELADDYRRLLREADDKQKLREEFQPSSRVVHYLYARSQHTLEDPQDKDTREALDFFRGRAFATWTAYGLYEQALITITARSRKSDLAQTIVESLRERAIRKDEFGMYWKYPQGYRWNNLPIETHTRLLEAFRVTDGSQEELDEMRLWLLTNKRTNRWPTTKATAAAVYALLNNGQQYAAKEDGKAIDVTWPDAPNARVLRNRVADLQQTAEAASGQFSLRLDADQVNSGLARVRVKNRENDLVWGGIYWQYTELAQKVEASDNGPLSLERELYKKVASDNGMRLRPITEDEPLAPGDRVTVRLTIRSDRDLDYVHLKDRRAATFEPVDALSVYKYDNGLGYYFAPGDLATNFFIDNLSRGTYVLEYDLFATYAGNFSNGLGRIQCMYAPEFGGNSSGGRIVVR